MNRENESSRCLRCPTEITTNSPLCNPCSSTFRRLRKEKYGGSKSFTVQVFIERHPPQLVRQRITSGGDGSYKIVGPGFLVCGPQTEALLKLTTRIALTRDSVFIQGETGVGKDGVARALHALGPRAHEPFISVNCASLSESLADSELFGHTRGAFTGSNGSTEGFFGAANRGTLFLDEAETLLEMVQAKLLRTIESGEIRPVGSSKPKKVDVRIIASTNIDGALLVKKGIMRKDLFYRLVHTMVVPPLRARKEEIPVLAKYFVYKSSNGMTRISDEAIELLRAYHWPGNIRELMNVLRQADLVREGHWIKATDLPHSVHSVHYVAHNVEPFPNAVNK